MGWGFPFLRGLEPEGGAWREEEAFRDALSLLETLYVRILRFQLGMVLITHFLLLGKYCVLSQLERKMPHRSNHLLLSNL